MANIGMETLVSGEEPVTVDVIFVHGLRGDRRKTWQKGNIVWPRDLLKSRIPHARIMTWGYDAQVINFFEKSGQSSIFNHSEQLLQDISIERSTMEERNRPIVFVSHSLGGIVVKDALYTAYQESKEDPVRKPRMAAVKSATMGIVFLGTPHRGSNKAKWASIATNFAAAVLKDHNDKVVEALSRGAETLERVQTGFSRILISLPVYSFFEDRQYEKIGKIVDDDSASLGFPHEEKGWIPANHSDMTKFETADDVGFKRVAHGIITLVEDGLAARQSSAAAAGNATRMKQRGSRYISIKEHIFDDPKLLSFGCDEFIDNVVPCPGKWWRGRHRGKTALFRKDSVDMAPDVDTPTHEIFPESWKKGSRLSRQNTLKTAEESWKPNPGVVVTEHVVATESSASEPAIQQGRVTSVPLHGSHTQEHQALLIAAEEGHENAVERLIKKGVDVNAIAGQYGHALAAAAYNGRKGVVKVLLNNGAKINLPGGRFGFALHAAAQEGHLDVVKVLLSGGANVQLEGGQFRFALTAAAYNGNVRMMKVLLDEDASLNAADVENETALHGAVFGGHIEAVEFLLKRGIDPEIRGVETGTALDMAISLGQQSIVNLLCGGTNEDSNQQPRNPNLTAEGPLRLYTSDSEPVANPEAEALVDKYLTMLLIISAQNGNLEDVQILLDAGVSPQSTWGDHGYALHAACVNGHLAVAQLLLEHGAQVNTFGGQTGYPLIAACTSGSIPLFLLLIAWDANIHMGTTLIGGPLHAASRAGHLDIMALLLLLGAKIDWQCGQFGTALLAAASCGVEPCQLLVSRGANVQAKAPDGMNGADVARAFGRADAKSYFKRLGVKSSSFFSIAGLASRLSSFTLKVEAANLEQESENFLQQQPGSRQISLS